MQVLGREEPKSQTLQVFEPEAEGAGVGVHASEAGSLRHCQEPSGEGYSAGP